MRWSGQDFHGLPGDLPLLRTRFSFLSRPPSFRGLDRGSQAQRSASHEIAPGERGEVPHRRGFYPRLGVLDRPGPERRYASPRASRSPDIRRRPLPGIRVSCSASSTRRTARGSTSISATTSTARSGVTRSGDRVPHRPERREVRWVGHVCRPVFGADGIFQGRRGSNRDITDRKRVEEESHGPAAIPCRRWSIRRLLRSSPSTRTGTSGCGTRPPSGCSAGGQRRSWGGPTRSFPKTSRTSSVSSGRVR